MVFAPAVAGIGDVAFFLVCLIVIYALTFLVMLLTGVFRYVPVIGPWVQDHLLSTVGSVLADAAGWARNGLGVGLGLIWTPITWLAALLGRIGETLWEAVNATDRIVHGAIPRSIDTSRAYADQRYWEAVAHADADAAAVAASAEAESMRVEAEARQLYTAAIDYATRETAAAEAYAQQETALAMTRADAQHAAAIDYTTRETAAAETFTQQLHQTSIAFTEAQIAGTQEWVKQDVGALEHKIADTLTVATTYAHDVAAATVAPVAAVAASTALSLTKYLEECGTNLCRGLNPLSTALQELAGILEGGVLFALLAEAVHDAPGVARELQSVAGPMVNDAAVAVKSAIGVTA